MPVTESVSPSSLRLIGTGRSDFPNQENNVLAFPGIFRGTLDAGAARITSEMKTAAARAGEDPAGPHWPLGVRPASHPSLSELGL